jgi:hypothetical protein
MPTDLLKNSTVRTNLLANQPVKIPETPRQSVAGTFLGGIKEGLGVTGEILKGAGKGVLSTLKGIGELSQKTGQGMIFEQIRKQPTEEQKAQDLTKAEILKPKGIAQKIGFGAEQVGEFFIPMGGATKAEKLLTTVLPKAGKLATFGIKTIGEATEYAFKTALQTGGDVPQTTGTFLLSLAIPPIIKGVGAGLKKIGTIFPERVYSVIFKTAADDLRQAYQSVAKGKQLNPTLAREVLDRGLKGSSKNMAVYAFNKLDDLEKQVQSLVTERTKPLVVGNKKSYERFLNEVINQFKGGFYTDRAKTASNLLKELSQTDVKQIGMGTALRLRRFIDNMRNTSAFRQNALLSHRQDEFKYAADLLRKKLADNGLSYLMNEERVFIQAIDDIVADATKRNNKNVIGLIDILAGGGGIASGSIIGGAGAAVAIRAFQQPFTLTNMARGIDLLTKKATGLGDFLSKATMGTIQQSKVGQTE